MFPSQTPVGVNVVPEADFPFQVIDEPTVWTSMSDGVRLAARVWRPATSHETPVPGVIEMIPYRRRDGTLPVDERIHPYWAGHGIAAVRVDLRGCGDSEGVLVDEYLARAHDDAISIIEWAAAQSWSDGSVGMTGLSWGGFNALQVAARRPQALKAIIAVGATVDRYNDDVHYKNGCLLNENFGWGSSLTAFTTRPPDPEVVPDAWREMWLNRLENLKFFAVPWHEHQTRDAYWKHGSVKENFEDIRVPVMIVSGWNDLYVNAVPELLGNLTGACRAIVGPWAHEFPHMATPGPVVDYLGETLAWWKRWLTTNEDQAVAEKSYLAFVKQGSRPDIWAERVPGTWMRESQWPGSGFEETSYWLTTDGLMPDRAPAPRCVIHSPLDTGVTAGEWVPHSRGPEVAGDQRAIDTGSILFDSQVLTDSVDILGNPVFSATLSSDATSANLVVRLCDVGPEGHSELVSIGVLNLSHRNGNDSPIAMPVGESVELSIRLDHCAHRFPIGHRIRLALSTAYWPYVWPACHDPNLILEPDPASLRLPCWAFDRSVLTDDLGLADITEPSRLQQLRAAKNMRVVKRDLASGITRLEIVDDFGEVKYLDHGLVNSALKQEHYEIAEGDLLSASAAIHWAFQLRRGDWQVRTETHASMTCDAENYFLSATVKAFEGEEKIFERSYQHTIVRIT